MFDANYFEELTKKIFSVLPSNFQQVEKDIEQKIKEILQACFSRLDLVTREEFDVQTKVLARTREKLDALQKQIETLIAEAQQNNRITH